MKKLMIAILVLATGCSQIVPVEIQIEVSVRIVPLSPVVTPVPPEPEPSPLATPVPPDRVEALELDPMPTCDAGGASFSKAFTWIPEQDYHPDAEGTCWCFDLPEDETGMCLPEHPEFPDGVTWVPADEQRIAGDVCWCWNVSPYSSGDQ